MNLRQVITTGVAGIILTGMSLTASQAQFAQFKSGKTAPGLFTFTNKGSSSTLTANTTVNFQFDENVKSGTSVYLKNQVVKATLVFSATTPAVATTSQGYDFQSLSNISIVFKDGAGHDLLTVSKAPSGSSTGSVFGQDTAKNATLAADASDGFIYSSSYLTFGPNNLNSYNLSMPLANALGQAGNKYLSNFKTASSSGTFDTVPEASTLLGFGSMLTGGGLLCLRLRKGSKTA